MQIVRRPKFGPTWYDVVEQFSFPSLVTDPGKKGVIGKLIHSSSCANFNQVQNAVSPNENPRYKTRGKVVPIFGSIYFARRDEFTFSFMNPDPGTNGTREKLFLSSLWIILLQSRGVTGPMRIVDRNAWCHSQFCTGDRCKQDAIFFSGSLSFVLYYHFCTSIPA